MDFNSSEQSDLEEISSYLAELQNPSLEVPAQYFEDIEPASDHRVRIDRFHSEVEVITYIPLICTYNSLI
jgi:hypothetical protein